MILKADKSIITESARSISDQNQTVEERKWKEEKLPILLLFMVDKWKLLSFILKLKLMRSIINNSFINVNILMSLFLEIHTEIFREKGVSCL